MKGKVKKEQVRTKAKVEVKVEEKMKGWVKSGAFSQLNLRFSLYLNLSRLRLGIDLSFGVSVV